MEKDYEKIFALKPIVPDTGQRNTRVFKKETVEKWKNFKNKLFIAKCYKWHGVGITRGLFSLCHTRPNYGV